MESEKALLAKSRESHGRSLSCALSDYAACTIAGSHARTAKQDRHLPGFRRGGGGTGDRALPAEVEHILREHSVG
jgi:hypothetical protein